MPDRRKRRTSPAPPPTATSSDDSPRAEVWLTDPAIEDLQRLDGSPLVWALKKMLLLETDPLAGEPLLGNLIGYRKLTVGNRDWRIVWRATSDDRGGVLVEIAEVWAVGARTDSAVYAEMARRVENMPDSPPRRALASVIAELGKRARGVKAHTDPSPTRPEPWLVDRLVHTAGLDRDTVDAMTSEQAVDAWTAYVSHPQ